MKTIIQIDKHKVKYIITACIPIIITKHFLLFFFTVYKNERKEQILTTKISRKATSTTKTKKY